MCNQASQNKMEQIPKFENYTNQKQIKKIVPWQKIKETWDRVI